MATRRRDMWCHTAQTPFQTSDSRREFGLNPASIFECFSAYQKTAAMQAAVDIGLFSALAAGQTTVAAAAKACEASPKGVRVLCDYWTINGLLTKTGDKS